MAVSTRRRIDEVLSVARKDLEAQLGVVRKEMARLADEEKELTQALAGLPAQPAPSSAPASGSNVGRRSRAQTAKSTTRRTGARRRRAAAKSTAERVGELRAALAEGPRSLKDLAAGLSVSPQRVQQLLAELGDSVSSTPNPGKGGKLWSIDGASSRGERATKPTASTAARHPKTRAARKPPARKTAPAR